jgi:uracil-DNA glycosylase
MPACLLLGKPPDTTLREMRPRLDLRGSGRRPRASLFVTYHPSYVIRREKELPPGQRNPADDTVMADLQQAILKLRAADNLRPQNS